MSVLTPMHSICRYLTISNNQLSSLPCSLMQCRLEHIDLSSNTFHIRQEVAKQDSQSHWDVYVSNLVHIASKVVLKNKLYYAPHLIPWTLIEFLDNAHTCVCGAPVVNDILHVDKAFDLKEFFRVVVFDSVTSPGLASSSSKVNFECYFCSPRCFSACVNRW